MTEFEPHLLAAAQAGDEHAFRRLVELHRASVHAHCYRMLGSFQDAEDAYQDTLLRAWRALDGFDGRSPLIRWLNRIATNVCLSTLQRSARVRTLPAELAARRDDSQPDWVGPYPDELLEIPSGFADPSARFEQRESIELAFTCALQLLPARQRAALLLCEVLGFRAAEVAEALETSVPAVNSMVQRARSRLDGARPAVTQQAAARSLGEPQLTRLVARFAAALEDGDTEVLVSMLTDDVVFEMPPHPDCARGRDRVAESWLVPTRRPTGLRTLVTGMNGQPAVAVYRRTHAGFDALPIALDVLTVGFGGVSRITAFRAPDSFSALGLPAALAASEPTTSRHPDVRSEEPL